jgi:hypothetical protein
MAGPFRASVLTAQSKGLSKEGVRAMQTIEAGLLEDAVRFELFDQTDLSGSLGVCCSLARYRERCARPRGGRRDSVSKPAEFAGRRAHCACLGRQSAVDVSPPGGKVRAGPVDVDDAMRGYLERMPSPARALALVRFLATALPDLLLGVCKRPQPPT